MVPETRGKWLLDTDTPLTEWLQHSEKRVGSTALPCISNPLQIDPSVSVTPRKLEKKDFRIQIHSTEYLPPALHRSKKVFQAGLLLFGWRPLGSHILLLGEFAPMVRLLQGKHLAEELAAILTSF